MTTGIEGGKRAQWKRERPMAERKGERKEVSTFSAPYLWSSHRSARRDARPYGVDGGHGMTENKYGAESVETIKIKEIRK